MAVPTYFRFDGWVKSANGPAVPGAQIYVLLQPASLPSSVTSTLFPTPQQPIFSDPNGVSPITQPISTDGFGHYDFYVTPGTYTIAVYLGGALQQFYQDQTIGLASGSSPTASSLIDVNGAPLSSNPQGIANFISSSSVTITDVGSGQIQASSIANSGVFTSSPSWWGSADGSPYSFSPNGGNIGNASNLILWYMFKLDAPFVFNKVAYRINAGGGSGCLAGFAIYNSTGTTKLASWDAMDVSANTTNHSFSISSPASPVTLNPGVYIFAFGRSGGTQAPNTDSGYSTSGSSDPSDAWNLGGNTRSGQAANSLSSGVMPSSLGALSTTTSMPANIFAATFSPS